MISGVGIAGWTLGTMAIAAVWPGGKRPNSTWEDLLRGTYVEGLTGTGKTTLLNEGESRMAVAHYTDSLAVGAGHNSGSVVKIDVADGCQRLLDLLSPDTDVVYVAPWMKDCPWHFNVLHRQTFDSEENQRVAGFLNANMAKTFDRSWGDVISHIFRFVCLAVLEANPKDQVTLNDMWRFLFKEKYRQDTLDRVKDPIIRGRLEGYDFKKDQSVDSVCRKLSDILSNRVLRETFAHPEGHDIRSMIESGKSVLFDFDTSKLDPWTSCFGAGLAVTCVQNATYGREAEKARPVLLVCDEFQRYASDSLEELLSQARKYCVATVLAHQSGHSQLQGGLKSAVHLASKHVYFRLMLEDASYAARRCGAKKVFDLNRSVNGFVEGLIGDRKQERPRHEQWEESDFVNLPAFTYIEAKTVNNVPIPARMGRVEKPDKIGKAKVIIEKSFAAGREKK